MRGYQGKPLRDVEVDDEPAPPWFSLTMRRRMALMGVAYFFVAVLLLSTTFPRMIDAYRHIQGIGVTEPPVDKNVTEEAEEGQDAKEINGTAPLGGDAVLLFENFHPYYTEWTIRQLPAEKSEMTIYYHDGLVLGYLYLNVTEDWSSEDGHWIEMCTLDEFAPPVGLQLRLKCSDDNGLQTDTGGGHRSWGFGERGPRFESFSPDSDEPLPGFWVTSGRGDSVTRNPVAGIDLTQWHDYAILWEQEKATFFVDGVLVASIDTAPSESMGAVCFLNNLFYRSEGSGDSGHWQLDHGYLDLGTDESIAIDYLCVAELGLWSQDEGFEHLVAEMYS